MRICTHELAQEDCTLCDAGTWSNATGATNASVCQPCPSGLFQTGLGATATSDCTPCISGTYQSGLGSVSPSACSPCPENSFSSTLGAVSELTCQQCQPVGVAYFPGTGKTSQSDCDTLATKAVKCVTCRMQCYTSGMEACLSCRTNECYHFSNQQAPTARYPALPLIQTDDAEL